MKKLLSAIAISVSAMMAASTVMATPEYGQNHSSNHQQNHASSQHQGNHQAPGQVKKNQQNHWKAGNKYPNEYRGAGYKIDYKHDKKLSQPSKNQQWYKADNKYVLVDTTTYTIVKVLGL